jgi:hypothetical protein
MALKKNIGDRRTKWLTRNPTTRTNKITTEPTKTFESRYSYCLNPFTSASETTATKRNEKMLAKSWFTLLTE